MARPRQQLLIPVACGCLIALNCWAYARLSSARSTAMQSTFALRADQQLVTDILKLRGTKASVGTKELADAEIAKEIERACAAGRFPPTAVLRIAPQAVQRIADSAYLDKPTQLLLHDVTLAQTFAFIQALAQSPVALRADSLHLITPRERASQSVWNIELTVAYRIYSPKPAGQAPRSSP